MQKTEHYQLNQYEPTDSFLRTNFNEDNVKIDVALSAKCEVVFGTYMGDGEPIRDISLGFMPKAILTFRENGIGGSDYRRYGGLSFPGHPIYHEGAVKSPILTVTETGFQVYFKLGSDGSEAGSNYPKAKFHYIAFR